MLTHPADGFQWREIDREFPDFADDARNLRFALSTDGFNPIGDQSSSHSPWPITLCNPIGDQSSSHSPWPITLCIYNLPLWLCMKQKFIMMPVLIQGL